MGCSRLRAELYKLNIYSGPSGKFKSHVDTPRSEDQIGSLVICLPAKHEGGDLVVRHQDRTVTFSWGASDCIEYAAFFSHLEHEVEEVSSVHRVTLTYNLYWSTPGPENEALPGPTAPESLPLYGEVEKTLGFEDFLPDGGVLGFYCAHSYVHNHEAEQVDLPRQLKGVDMAFYSACKAQGLEIFVRPVRGPEETQWRYRSSKKDKDQESLQGEEGYYDRRRFRLQNKNGEPAPTDFVLKYEHEAATEQWKIKEEAGSFSERLARIKRERRLLAIEEPTKRREQVTARVGEVFTGVDINGEEIPEGDVDEILAEAWEPWPNVVWLNEPRHYEFQKAYLTYGNEPELGWFYTCAAILVRISPLAERRKAEQPTTANS